MSKYAAVINDISGFGRCSLVADISVLAAMGISPCPIPTAVLTGQTEYEDYFMRDMSGDLDHYLTSFSRMGKEFSGILTGFLTNPDEARFAAAFIQEFRRPETIVLVDPVMADEGETYANYSDALLSEMKKLVRMADIITPNLTELGLLAGKSLSEQSRMEEIAEAAERVAAGSRTAVVITGVPGGMDSVGNLCVTAGGRNFYGAKRLGKDYSGAGDLLAASVLGGRMQGLAWEEIMERFNRMFEAAANDAAAEGTAGNDGVPYEKYLKIMNHAKGGRV